MFSASPIPTNEFSVSGTWPRERDKAEYERHADYRRHKHVIEDAIMRRLLGDAAPEREVVIRSRRSRIAFPREILQSAMGS